MIYDSNENPSWLTCDDLNCLEVVGQALLQSDSHSLTQ